MVQLPQGIPGWTVFLTGIFIIAYRVHGIDAPREWIEWLDHQFSAKRDLQVYGGLLFVITLIVGYFGTFIPSTIGWLYIASLVMLGVLGLALVATQNSVRLLVVATAEEEDKTIKIWSVLIVVVGLLWVLAPWFL